MTREIDLSARIVNLCKNVSDSSTLDFHFDLNEINFKLHSLSSFHRFYCY